MNHELLKNQHHYSKYQANSGIEVYSNNILQWLTIVAIMMIIVLFRSVQKHLI